MLTVEEGETDLSLLSLRWHGQQEFQAINLYLGVLVDNMRSVGSRNTNTRLKKVHTRLLSSEAEVLMSNSSSCKCFIWCSGFRPLILGWEYQQTRQRRHRQDHTQGRGGGEDAIQFRLATGWTNDTQAERHNYTVLK